MTLLDSTLLLLAGVALTSVGVALRWRSYWPVAILFVAVLGKSLVRWRVYPIVQSSPSRGLFHMDSALYAIDPFAEVAAALAVFAGRAALPVIAPWAAAVGVLVLGYPTLTGDALRRAYLVPWIVALAVGVVVIGWWARAGRVRLPHFALALVVAVEFVVLLVGPWREGLYGPAFDTAQKAYSLLFVVLLLLHGGALLWPRKA